MDQMETEDSVAPADCKEDINGDVDDTGQSGEPNDSNKLASIDNKSDEAMEVDEGIENVPETNDPSDVKDKDAAVSNVDDDNSVSIDNEVEPSVTRDPSTSQEKSAVESAEMQEGDIEYTEQDLAVEKKEYQPEVSAEPEAVESVEDEVYDSESNKNVQEDNDFGTVNGVKESTNELDADIQTSNVDENVNDDDLLNDDNVNDVVDDNNDNDDDEILKDNEDAENVGDANDDDQTQNVGDANDDSQIENVGDANDESQIENVGEANDESQIENVGDTKDDSQIENVGDTNDEGQTEKVDDANDEGQTDNVDDANDEGQTDNVDDVTPDSETKESSLEKEETLEDKNQPMDTEADDELQEASSDVKQDIRGEESGNADDTDVNTESAENTMPETGDLITDNVNESEEKEENFDDLAEMNITENIDSEENDCENSTIDSNEGVDCVKDQGMTESGNTENIADTNEMNKDLTSEGDEKNTETENVESTNEDGGDESLLDAKSDKGGNSEESMEVDAGLKIDSVESIKESIDESKSEQVTSDITDDTNKDQNKDDEASSVKETSTEVEDKETESESVTKDTEMDTSDKSEGVSEGSVSRKSVSPTESDVMAGVHIKEERLSSTDDASRNMSALYPGPFCKEIDLTSDHILDNKICPLPEGCLKNGLALELKSFAYKNNKTHETLVKWLYMLQPQSDLSCSAAISRIAAVDKKAKLLGHKKKVKGYKSGKEFRTATLNVMKGIKKSKRIKSMNSDYDEISSQICSDENLENKYALKEFYAENCHILPESITKVSESEGSSVSNLKIVGVASSVSSENVDGKGDKSLKSEGTTENSDTQQDKKPVLSKAKGDEDNDVIAVKEEKKPVPKKSSKIQTCIVCHKVVKCKYNIVRNGDVKHLCDDNCFKCFRADPTTYLKQAETKPTDKPTAVSESQTKESKQPEIAPKPVEIQPPTPAANQQTQVYKTCTVCQLMNVRTSKPFLNWQGLDFCGEECLGKFQYGLGSNCSYCSGPIFPNNKTRFCCRVGNDVKHFCSSNCQSDFIKRMKLCAFCNKDLTQVKDSFMAPVGNQGTFKDFCSQSCLQKFEERNNKDKASEQAGHKTAVAPVGDFTCAVCSKVGPVKHEFKLDSKLNRLCSDPCFSAFQYANKLTLNTCDNCSTNLNSEMQAPQYVQFEGQQKRFCSFMCVNSFINSNKKTVLCAWCSTKKSNFDMIERVDANSKYQLFCSLNCLSLYRVNLQASSNQSVVCDQCRKYVPAQYHLTMSDASVRNFCSYGCVMQFQQQFQLPAKQNSSQPKTVSQLILQQKQQQTTTTRSGRVVTKGAKVVANEQQQQKPGKKDGETFPVISNVRSLAPPVPAARTNVNQSVGTTQIPTPKVSVTSPNMQQKVIIQPPPPKSMKNKSLLCKPITQTKATSCRPHTQMKEVQTEGKPEPDKLPVPVPVPIYCPTPLAMYSLPTPILIPVPVPIPVPIFIPTTKKSANSILKQIKEIRERIPADPLEAELLMMAEAVAGKDEDSSSSSEEEETPVPEVKETPAVSAPSGGGSELGEDMLQMALRLASQMSDEPVMDLESSLEPVAVNTDPPPQPKPDLTPEPEEEEEYIPSARTRRSRGSNKRQSRSNTSSRRNPKRQKIEMPQVYREPTPSPPPPAAPPPDANFHLKYTYGVNAFKHWVIQKNTLIEQSRAGYGKSVKTFKSDILQSTADELNYALCLFVKEVRKPNGEEYAVDSIYYLCLGIQQYLFENGRIDNIFTDFYYEKFTEALNEILTRYEPKLNHAGQLVCRIEEEHLWESKQLGAHSPHVLLNSLVYFNTKYFMLKTSDDHLKLSFTHIMKHWKKTASGRGSGTGPNAGRSVYLRYYCPTPQGKVDNQKKKKEEMPVYEQTENLENPLRCPVKLYEFYLSKCPESIKSRNDTFYLQAERSSVPDSPVWYSNISVDGNHLAKLLNRIRLVREIQEAHLHTQPVYI